MLVWGPLVSLTVKMSILVLRSQLSLLSVVITSILSSLQLAASWGGRRTWTEVVALSCVTPFGSGLVQFRRKLMYLRKGWTVISQD